MRLFSDSSNDVCGKKLNAYVTMKFMHDEQAYYLTTKEFGCSDIEEFLDYYLDRAIIPSILTRFEFHLEHCESCRNLVEDCQHILSVAKTLGDQPIPSDVRQRLRCALQKKVGHSSPGCNDPDYTTSDFKNTTEQKAKLSLVRSDRERV